MNLERLISDRGAFAEDCHVTLLIDRQRTCISIPAAIYRSSCDSGRLTPVYRSASKFSLRASLVTERCETVCVHVVLKYVNLSMEYRRDRGSHRFLHPF